MPCTELAQCGHGPVFVVYLLVPFVFALQFKSGSDVNGRDVAVHHSNELQCPVSKSYLWRSRDLYRLARN